MLNHLRTLLLDADGREALPAELYPGEELVPEGYRPLRPGGPLSRLRLLLFGGRPDRAQMNLRLHWYLALLHGDPFYERYVLALDTRVSYLPLREEFFTWLLTGPRVTPLGATTAFLQVSGYATAVVLGEAGGRLYHEWTLVEVLDATHLLVEYADDLGTPTSATLTYATQPGGMAGPVTLPGANGQLEVSFEPVTGAKWKIQVVLRSAHQETGMGYVMSSVLAGIDLTIEEALFSLQEGQDREPISSLAILWREGHSSFDKMAAVLLAYAWQLEHLRRRREGEITPYG